jgi:hypothetical protein
MLEDQKSWISVENTFHSKINGESHGLAASVQQDS